MDEENLLGTALPAPVDPYAAQEARFKEQQAQPPMDWSEALSRSIGLTHVASNVRDIDAYSGFAPDPNWTLPDTLLDDISNAGLPASWVEELADSQSQAEYEARLMVLERRAGDESLLAGLGGKGIAAKIVASMIDPVGVAVDLASGGIGAAAKTRKLWKVATAAGVGSAAVGQFQAAADPEYDATNLLVDFAAGASFGLMFEGASQFMSKADAQTIAVNMQRAAAAVANTQPKQRLRLGPNNTWEPVPEARLDSAGAARVADTEVESSINVDVGLGNQGGGRDVRDAMRARGEENEGLVSKSPYLGGFGDNVAVTRNLPDMPEANEFGRLHFADSVAVQRMNPQTGKMEDVVNEISASDLAVTGYRQLWTGFREKAELAMRSILGTGKRLFSTEARVEVNRAAGRAYKMGTRVSEHHDKIVSAYRETMDEIWRRMQRAKVKGVVGAQKASDYVTRMFRRELTDVIHTKFRGLPDNVNAVLRDLYMKGIKSAFAKLGRETDDELTGKVADAFVNRALYARNNPQSIETSELDHDFLDEILDSIPGNEAEKQKIYLHFTGKDKTTGPEAQPVSFLKHRVPLDETVSVTLSNGQKLSLLDLYEDDLEHLADVYTRKASGIIAYAERGWDNHRDVVNYINTTAAEISARLGDRRGKIWKAAHMSAYNHNMGNPINEGGVGIFARLARNIMGINFVRQMGSVAASMMAENGAIMATVSNKSLMKVLTELPAIMKSMATGKMDNRLARSLMAMTGVGGGQLRAAVSRRYTDTGLVGAEPARGLGWFENILSGLEKAQSVLSGLGPIQDAQQMTFAMGFSQDLLEWATHGNMPPRWMDRMKGYGMSERNLEKLFEHLRTTALKDEHGALLDWNHEAMSPALRRRTEVFLHRAITHVIQEADIGATHWWAHNPAMRLAMQFRQFSLTAFTRRTLHGIHHRDAITGMMFGFGAMWGTLGISSRIYLTNPSDSPMREKLGDPVAMAKIAFASTGESSIIPALWDTLVHVGGMQELAIGNANRSTGNATTLVEGIPAVNLANAVARSLSIPANLIKPGGQVTDKDVAALISLIPLNNLWAINRFWKNVPGWVAPNKEVQFNAIVENTEQ